MPNPTQSLVVSGVGREPSSVSQRCEPGSAVQATLWSGPGEVLTTDGFVRDPERILRVLIGYFGGSTQFPLGGHCGIRTLRRGVLRRKVHLLQISDEGIDTMVADTDTPDDLGWSARRAMKRAGGGGTMVLQLWGPLDPAAGRRPPQPRQPMSIASHRDDQEPAGQRGLARVPGQLVGSTSRFRPFLRQGALPTEGRC